eukprot:TRINITY_DN8763_c0_g1_i1.p1 TRINITY_DN8763_c0_g1~~TRINITY_DN8763_c0_g1_i1.p1  ORF type:complete len:580 (-),score=95.57 TRINITY_DN8763_c0_g1_i1:562-2301(-)
MHLLQGKMRPYVLSIVFAVLLVCHFHTAQMFPHDTNDPNRIQFFTPGFNDYLGQNIAITQTHILAAAPGNLLPGRLEVFRRRGTGFIEFGRDDQDEASIEYEESDYCEDVETSDGNEDLDQQQQQQQVYRMVAAKPIIITTQSKQTNTSGLNDGKAFVQRASVTPSATVQQYEYLVSTYGSNTRVLNDFGVSVLSIGKTFVAGSLKLRNTVQTGGIILYLSLQITTQTITLMTCYSAPIIAGANVGCLLAFGKPYIVAVACGTRSIAVFRYASREMFTCFHYQPVWAPASIDSLAACVGYFVFASITSRKFEVFANIGLDTWKSHGIVDSPAYLDPQRGGQASDFGAAVAIDQEIIVIGAPATSGSIGCVVFYSTTTLSPYKTLWPPGNATSGRFGSRLALSGNYLAVSATGCHATLRPCLSGAVFLFRKDGVHLQTFRPIDGLNGDMYGVGIALNHYQLCVGATRQYSTLYGALYLYQSNGSAWDESYIASPTISAQPSPSSVATPSQLPAPSLGSIKNDSSEQDSGDTTVIIGGCLGGGAVGLLSFGYYRRRKLSLRSDVVLPYSEKDMPKSDLPTS